MAFNKFSKLFVLISLLSVLSVTSAKPARMERDSLQGRDSALHKNYVARIHQRIARQKDVELSLPVPAQASLTLYDNDHTTTPASHTTPTIHTTTSHTTPTTRQTHSTTRNDKATTTTSTITETVQTTPTTGLTQDVALSSGSGANSGSSSPLLGGLSKPFGSVQPSLKPISVVVPITAGNALNENLDDNLIQGLINQIVEIIGGIAGTGGSSGSIIPSLDGVLSGANGLVPIGSSGLSDPVGNNVLSPALVEQLSKVVAKTLPILGLNTGTAGSGSSPSSLDGVLNIADKVKSVNLDSLAVLAGNNALSLEQLSNLLDLVRKALPILGRTDLAGSGSSGLSDVAVPENVAVPAAVSQPSKVTGNSAALLGDPAGATEFPYTVGSDLTVD